MMWAKSHYPHGGGRSPVWHVVTVAAWDAQKLQTTCDRATLQRQRSDVRTEPPERDACPRCLHALRRCDAACRVGHHAGRARVRAVAQ